MSLFNISGNNKTDFHCSVFGAESEKIQFRHISFLKTPQELDSIMESNQDRVINIGVNELSLFVKLYDEQKTPVKQARLPAIYSKNLLTALKKIAEYPTRLSDLGENFYTTPSTCWNEVTSQNDGTIKKQTEYSGLIDNCILSGPHFFVSNPFSKNPQQICSANSHYDCIDLISIPDDYLPRTNYQPACDNDKFSSKIPRVTWMENDEKTARRVSSYYRVAYRAMIDTATERTLSCAIYPPKLTHTNAVRSYAFKDTGNLLSALLCHCSIPFDFILKTTGKQNLHTTLEEYPLIEKLGESTYGKVLALTLNCLTVHYAGLWSTCWNPNFSQQQWSIQPDSDHPGAKVLPQDFFRQLTPDWQRNNALRTDYARRQALLEIDVLVAQALGMCLDELLTIYRVQFSTMKKYEADTWYDQNGRIIFTPSMGLVGVGLPRNARRTDLNEGTSYGLHTQANPDTNQPARNETAIPLGWNDVKDLQKGDTVTKTYQDNTQPGGPIQRTITYQAPFFKPNREQDYAVVWEFFEKEENQNV